MWHIQPPYHGEREGYVAHTASLAWWERKEWCTYSLSAWWEEEGGYRTYPPWYPGGHTTPWYIPQYVSLGPPYHGRCDSIYPTYAAVAR